MKNFDYVHISSKAEALDVLDREGEKSCLVAGATNVMPFIRAEKLNNKTLINIRHLHELRFITEMEDKILIGPLTTIHDLEHAEIIEKYAPVLREAARNFADPTTRNSATIAGNIANASPAADTATPLLALNATVVAESKTRGERKIPIGTFFKGVNKTALACDELITGIEVPKKAANSASTFIKLGLRNAMAISVVSVAAGVEIEAGRIKEVNIALGSVAPTPVRAEQVEAFLAGKEISLKLLEEAAEKVNEDISPIGDVRASGEYRKMVAPVIVRRALAKSAQL
ncbi:FAD binding domain-containing protein [Candidatus Formimonas warabiya]|uniref:FAD binding domain-containing protein n=1 Tax=Formimonas warabiya TaxID=1761012 RepID=UPI001BE457A5|nr:xanthine dehydrogenase family protein subunit M [Candidatus Formimonas warabiya]